MKAAPKTKLLDINILPEEYRRRWLTRREFFLVCLILVCVYAGYSFYAAGPALRSDLARLQQEQQRLLKEADDLRPTVELADELRQDIADLKAVWEEVSQSRQALASQRIDWKALLTSIRQPPTGIEIRSLTQSPNSLVLTGISRAQGTTTEAQQARDMRIFEYAALIGRSPAVSEVVPVPGTLEDLSRPFTIVITVEAGSAPLD